MDVFLVDNISNNYPDLHELIASDRLNNNDMFNDLDSDSTLLPTAFTYANHQASNNTSNGNQQISNVNLKYNRQKRTIVGLHWHTDKYQFKLFKYQQKELNSFQSINHLKEKIVEVTYQKFQQRNNDTKKQLQSCINNLE